MDRDFLSQLSIYLTDFAHAIFVQWRQLNHDASLVPTESRVAVLVDVTYQQFCAAMVYILLSLDVRFRKSLILAVDDGVAKLANFVFSNHLVCNRCER